MISEAGRNGRRSGSLPRGVQRDGRPAGAAAESARRSPWVTGIIVMFVVIVLVNAGFIYIAVKGADPVVPSYSSEQR